MAKTIKRKVSVSKPKPLVPSKAGITLNPKRRFGCGGKKKS